MIDTQLDSGSDQIVPRIDCDQLITLVEARRISRNQSIDQFAKKANISRATYLRLKKSKKDSSSYKTLCKVMRESMIDFYIEGLPSSRPIMTHISQLVFQKRKSLGLSLRELSDKSNVAVSVIFYFEKYHQQYENQVLDSIGFGSLVDILHALNIGTAIIQTDDKPITFEALQLYNEKRLSGDPMYQSPFNV